MRLRRKSRLGFSSSNQESGHENVSDQSKHQPGWAPCRVQLLYTCKYEINTRAETLSKIFYLELVSVRPLRDQELPSLSALERARPAGIATNVLQLKRRAGVSRSMCQPSRIKIAN